MKLLLLKQISSWTTHMRLLCRFFIVGTGGLVGDLDFVLQRERSFRVTCEEGAQLLSCSRPSMSHLAAHHPQVHVDLNGPRSSSVGVAQLSRFVLLGRVQRGLSGCACCAAGLCQLRLGTLCGALAGWKCLLRRAARTCTWLHAVGTWYACMMHMHAITLLACRTCCHVCAIRGTCLPFARAHW